MTSTARIGAGLLVYRKTRAGPEFLLGHPGGPFWSRRDEAAWSIPKGLVDEGEPLWDAARREFAEETGQTIVAAVARIALTPCRLSGGKILHAWLIEADLDVSTFTSNTFEMEWPPKSGRSASFPEIDRAAYFNAVTAAFKIHKGQRPLLDEAIARLAADPTTPR